MKMRFFGSITRYDMGDEYHFRTDHYYSGDFDFLIAKMLFDWVDTTDRDEKINNIPFREFFAECADNFVDVFNTSDAKYPSYEQTKKFDNIEYNITFGYVPEKD